MPSIALSIKHSLWSEPSPHVLLLTAPQCSQAAYNIKRSVGAAISKILQARWLRPNVTDQLNDFYKTNHMVEHKSIRLCSVFAMRKCYAILEYQSAI
jgi:hypothetical protein